MHIFLAFVFLTAAFFAEPIVERMPGWGSSVRSVLDDFGEGDPYKIVHYKAATATITGKSMDSANIKYNIKGYLMQTGINARNAPERRLMNITPIGGQMLIYYDEVNPTICVMQATYNSARNKLKGRVGKRGHPSETKRKKHFIPGQGYNTKVNYFRIGCICIGLFFLAIGARQLKAM